jgi:hypothetical protein
MEESNEFEEELTVAENSNFSVAENSNFSDAENSNFFDGPQRSQTMPNISATTLIDVPATVFETERPEVSKLPKPSKIPNLVIENHKNEKTELFSQSSKTVSSAVSAWSKSTCRCVFRTICRPILSICRTIFLSTC